MPIRRASASTNNERYENASLNSYSYSALYYPGDMAHLAYTFSTNARKEIFIFRNICYDLPVIIYFIIVIASQYGVANRQYNLCYLTFPLKWGLEYQVMSRILMEEEVRIFLRSFKLLQWIV